MTAGSDGFPIRPGRHRTFRRSGAIREVRRGGGAGVEAIVCDLDGVVRHWSPRAIAEVETRRGLPRGAIRSVAFEPELLRQAITGKIADEAWRAVAAAHLVDRYGLPAVGAVEEWTDLAGSIDHDMVALIQELRRCVPVALLSNGTTRLESDLARHGVLDAFDVIANSADLGAAKPDEAAYRGAALLLGVGVARCVVIDDREEHVEGARRAGMGAIHHRNVASTRTALETFGLVTAPVSGS